MVMADSTTIDPQTPEDAANEVIAKWGVIL
jgi:hypothetical protein